MILGRVELHQRDTAAAGNLQPAVRAHVVARARALHRADGEFRTERPRQQRRLRRNAALQLL